MDKKTSNLLTEKTTFTPSESQSKTKLNDTVDYEYNFNTDSITSFIPPDITKPEYISKTKCNKLQKVYIECINTPKKLSLDCIIEFNNFKQCETNNK